MARTTRKRIFDTDRRIRLGIWGLGRGMSFYHTCRALNIDVVAGCDYNAHMRERFLAANPGAFATADAAEFLAQDFDAVLLATFCPAHADDAIACVKAGKHVLAEVTSFHTMAEGVRLVEAVEASGLVYNLAENYPFSAANMWLQRRWQEGLFGEMMYAEYEYVHEVLTLAYTYIDGTPIVPGNQAHSWRSWINYHYYNTHSLGPVMFITGLRPTRVTALPGEHRLPGYLMRGIHGMGGIAPSLINMSNGSIMRNLMGATTNDTHVQRIWGTKGSAQMRGSGLELRLGGRGNSPMHQVTPHWDDLGALAAKTGHGGGDFWVLYFFARQILTGEPAPFDIYRASDCTIPGIQAYRSSVEGGAPCEVPDFRDPAQREPYRDDHFAQPRYDAKHGLFPSGADEAITTQFSRVMRDLVNATAVYRAYRDWARVADDITDITRVLELADKAISVLPQLREVQAAALKIARHYPESDAARVLSEMLEVGEVAFTQRPESLGDLEAERRQLARRAARRLAAATRERKKTDYHSPFITTWSLSKLVSRGKGGIAGMPCVSLEDRLQWKEINNAVPMSGVSRDFVNIHQVFGEADGVAYLANRFRVDTPGEWKLLVGHDSGCKVFVNGEPVLVKTRHMNPAPPDRAAATIALDRGEHEIVIAVDTARGNGWGVFARFQLPPERRVKGVEPAFPARIEK